MPYAPVPPSVPLAALRALARGARTAVWTGGARHAVELRIAPGRVLVLGDDPARLRAAAPVLIASTPSGLRSLDAAEFG